MYIPFCSRVKTFFGKCPEKGAVHIMPLRCKKWSCSYCARRNCKAITARIIRGKPTKLITLTVRSSPSDDPGETYRRVRGQIRRLTQKIRRQFGKFESVTICELHKSGFPHWHMLVRSSFIPQTWLSRTWEELTGSPIVDIRAINRPEEAVHYVTKYVLKSTGKNKPKWLTRVCQFSKNYASPLKWLPPDGWYYELKPLDPREYICFLLDQGRIGCEVKNGTLFARLGEELDAETLSQFEEMPADVPP